jgi:hypothetical protein
MDDQSGISISQRTTNPILGPQVIVGRPGHEDVGSTNGFQSTDD